MIDRIAGIVLVWHTTMYKILNPLVLGLVGSKPFSIQNILPIWFWDIHIYICIDLPYQYLLIVVFQGKCKFVFRQRGYGIPDESGLCWENGVPFLFTERAMDQEVDFIFHIWDTGRVHIILYHLRYWKYFVWCDPAIRVPLLNASHCQKISFEKMAMILINVLRLRQNGHHFADDISKCLFFNILNCDSNFTEMCS